MTVLDISNGSWHLMMVIQAYITLQMLAGMDAVRTWAHQPVVAAFGQICSHGTVALDIYIGVLFLRHDAHHGMQHSPLAARCFEQAS